MAEAVADSRTDRILEALRRAVERLPREWDAIRAEMSEPETLLGLAVILAALIGVQFTPIAGLVDLIAALAGAYQLVSNAAGLVAAAVEAAGARNEAELNAAADSMAREIAALGVDVAAGLLGLVVFKQIKRLVKTVRPKLLKGRLFEAAEVVGGAGAGITAVKQAPVVGSAAASVLKVGLPVAGGVLLIVLLSRWSSARRRRRGS